MKPTIIIGGGIVGLFTAYYLQKEGVEVQVIDQGDMQVNCSTGNAGMIVPSHIIPLAAPGMISKGISWMFSSKSPFYIHPRLDAKLLKWCYQFYRAANPKHVERSVPILKNLSLLSKALYQEFRDEHPESLIALQEKGLMMIYQTEAVEKEEIEFAHLANANGLQADILSPADIRTFEPNLEVKARGAVRFPGDAHLDPGKLYGFLKSYLLEKGVKFLPNTTVTGFEKSSDSIKAVITDQGKIEAEKVILCGGSWSGKLADMLGFNLPMMGGKGYSFLQENQPEIIQSSILTEMKVAVSPYGEQVRFGGTMEIAGTNQQINMNRVKGIFESINRFYPDFEAKFPEQNKIWKGLRPCSPDGLPYIGFAPGYSNVMVNSGHSMMGISLAPASGKIISELHQQKDTTLGLKGFEVDRYM
ncbi:FAD-dependent oxidoreductase [Algoriphagus halophytocola]|uniref:FAD-dependent oxidoreductase n=1 Tax=Algoriphagus halophytocola TaxID=2991499 RepID=A0ABY6MH83_9BACT|nr:MULTISPECIES: FAD-dependent oxidoreductase [unclassified Algoriphagus]UZD22021.1 FAD-dependent oxidoreductase [Algoriphagus sp. TR-M5]WBL43272.1 FAD-dependent oxidoreductase [Algoriphagus sp. TR-M9]